MDEPKRYIVMPDRIEEQAPRYGQGKLSNKELGRIRREKVRERIAKDLNDIGEFTIEEVYSSSLDGLLTLTNEQVEKVRNKGYSVEEDVEV